jgi:hypothetical protein
MDALLEDAPVVFSYLEKGSSLDDNGIVACFVLYNMLYSLRTQLLLTKKHLTKLMALISR